jgi:hypothetical protein
VKGIIIRIFTDPEWARVFWQAVSVLVSALGVVALVLQIRATGKRVTEASIRFLWSQLRTERQQMEADVTKIDIEQGDLERRREQLAKGIYRVSWLSQAIESRYPDVFLDWFKEEADARRDSFPVI